MQQKRGFTLIEIVVVIVLIGILSAVALPRFFDFTTKAEQATVKATSGALASGASLLQTQWLIDNQPETITVGPSVLNMNGAGYPTGLNGGTQSEQSCAAIANALLDDNSVRFGVISDLGVNNIAYVALPPAQLLGQSSTTRPVFALFPEARIRLVMGEVATDPIGVTPIRVSVVDGSPQYSVSPGYDASPASDVSYDYSQSPGYDASPASDVTYVYSPYPTSPVSPVGSSPSVTSQIDSAAIETAFSNAPSIDRSQTICNQMGTCSSAYVIDGVQYISQGVPTADVMTGNIQPEVFIGPDGSQYTLQQQDLMGMTVATGMSSMQVVLVPVSGGDAVRGDIPYNIPVEYVNYGQSASSPYMYDQGYSSPYYQGYSSPYYQGYSSAPMPSSGQPIVPAGSMVVPSLGASPTQQVVSGTPASGTPYMYWHESGLQEMVLSDGTRIQQTPIPSDAVQGPDSYVWDQAVGGYRLAEPGEENIAQEISVYLENGALQYYSDSFPYYQGQYTDGTNEYMVTVDWSNPDSMMAPMTTIIGPYGTESGEFLQVYNGASGPEYYIPLPESVRDLMPAYSDILLPGNPPIQTALYYDDQGNRVYLDGAGVLRDAPINDNPWYMYVADGQNYYSDGTGTYTWNPAQQMYVNTADSSIMHPAYIVGGADGIVPVRTYVDDAGEYYYLEINGRQYIVEESTGNMLPIEVDADGKQSILNADGTLTPISASNYEFPVTTPRVVTTSPVMPYTYLDPVTYFDPVTGTISPTTTPPLPGDVITYGNDPYTGVIAPPIIVNGPGPTYGSIDNPATTAAPVYQYIFDEDGNAIVNPQYVPPAAAPNTAAGTGTGTTAANGPGSTVGSCAYVYLDGSVQSHLSTAGSLANYTEKVHMITYDPATGTFNASYQ